MNNLQVYDALKEVPNNALKEIKAGRLKGMSDINPMWRIKALTEQFGVCGFGWKYEIAEKRLEQGADGNVSAFVDINLYVKIGDDWSDPIPGTGGSSFVAKETRGLHTSDECFKMALTDAIGVACKALGMAANVYWNNDRTKYNGGGAETKQTPTNGLNDKLKDIKANADSLGLSTDDLRAKMEEMFGVKKSTDLTMEQAETLNNKILEEMGEI